jgi:purine nucleoside phosphorylase
MCFMQWVCLARMHGCQLIGMVGRHEAGLASQTKALRYSVSLHGTAQNPTPKVLGWK